MPDGSKSKVKFKNTTQMQTKVNEKKIIKPLQQQQQQKQKQVSQSTATAVKEIAVTTIGSLTTKSGPVTRRKLHDKPEAASGGQKISGKVYLNTPRASASSHDELADEETMTVENYVRLLQNRLMKEFQSHSIADDNSPLTAPFIFTQDVILTLEKRVLNAIQVSRAVIEFFQFLFIFQL